MTIIYQQFEYYLRATSAPPSEGGSLLGGGADVEHSLRMRMHSEGVRNAQLFHVLLMYHCHFATPPTPNQAFA